MDKNPVIECERYGEVDKNPALIKAVTIPDLQQKIYHKNMKNINLLIKSSRKHGECDQIKVVKLVHKKSEEELETNEEEWDNYP